MEVRDIKALVALMRENGLVELEIEDRKGKVRLVRGEAGTALAPAGKAETSRKPLPAKSTPAKTGRPAEQGAMELGPNQVLVSSPMVGTFYRAASPEADPFVEEGDAVRKGQPLCIIEAMKMMNEIESEVAGRVVRILVENSQPIEYGHPLMVLEVAS